MSVRTMPGTRPRNGLLADWKPYVYGETRRGRSAAAPARRGRNWGRLVPLSPPSCGSPAGRWAHRRRGEKPCEACREAYNASRRKGTPRGRPRSSECGSEAGYRRHLVDDTPVCGQCREAVNAVNRERYAVTPCRKCRYLRTARGHLVECLGEAA